MGGAYSRLVVGGVLAASLLASADRTPSVCPLVEPYPYHYYVLVDASSSMFDGKPGKGTGSAGESRFSKSIEALRQMISHVAARYQNVTLDIRFFYGVGPGHVDPFATHPSNEDDMVAGEDKGCSASSAATHATHLGSNWRRFAVEPVTAANLEHDTKALRNRERAARVDGRPHWMTPLWEAMRNIRLAAQQLPAGVHPRLVVVTDGEQEFAAGKAVDVACETRRWQSIWASDQEVVQAIYLGSATGSGASALDTEFPGVHRVVDLDSSDFKALGSALEGAVPTGSASADWPQDAVLRLDGTSCVATVVSDDTAITAGSCQVSDETVLRGSRVFRVVHERAAGEIAVLRSREVLPESFDVRREGNEGTRMATIGVVVDEAHTLQLETDDLARLDCHRRGGWEDCKKELASFLGRRHRAVPTGAPIVEQVCTGSTPVWRVVAIVTGPREVAPVPQRGNP